MSPAAPNPLWPAAALVALTLLLPVRLPTPSSGPANAECLTLSDTAPDGTRIDRAEVFERCSALNPADVELVADLGRLQEAGGRLADAEASYRRALRLDPGYADVRVRLGRLLLKRGDAVGAREQAEAARDARPNGQAVVDLLADTHGARASAARQKTNDTKDDSVLVEGH